MKIGIDISQIVYQGTGVARFTEGLVKAILNNDKKNQWRFFFSSLRSELNKDLGEKILQKGHQLVKWKIPNTFLSFLWNDLHHLSKSFMTYFSCFNDLDWFITSDWTEPPLTIKKATVVHDLVYCRYPETLAKKIRKTQEKRLTLIKEESRLIFVDSKTTRDDLINFIKIDKKRVVVNSPGVDVTKPSKGQMKKTLNKYHLKKPFVLTVGKMEPRKNLGRLIEAFQKLNNRDIDLVVVGPKGWQEVNNITIKQYNNIKILGFIEDTELYSLYSSCLFFIYPSLWEGFGYPIIEAMKLAAPIACSNTSSLKEIADGAALFFDPFNVVQITQSINELTRNKSLRENLIIKGKEKAKIFSWKNYYNKLINLLEVRS